MCSSEDDQVLQPQATCLRAEEYCWNPCGVSSRKDLLDLFELLKEKRSSIRSTRIDSSSFQCSSKRRSSRLARNALSFFSFPSTESSEANSILSPVFSTDYDELKKDFSSSHFSIRFAHLHSGALEVSVCCSGHHSTSRSQSLSRTKRKPKRTDSLGKLQQQLDSTCQFVFV